LEKLEDLFDLNGKVALVTGGAGYLGRSITEALAELGAIVVIASRNLKKCNLVASEITEDFNNEVEVYSHRLDISEDESIIQLVEDIKKDYGGLDILVNNAYSGQTNSLESISKEDWDNNLDTGLNSVFNVIKNCLPLLKESHGVILNVASMYGHIAPDPELYENNDYTNPPSYGAAKAGIIQLTKYLASFLSQYGIRTNAISPGPFPHGDVLNDIEFINSLSKKNTLNRIGKNHEMKGTVALLCSEASSYINGENIKIDGGWTIS
jgi:gluconate 5-dehydrogenase